MRQNVRAPFFWDKVYCEYCIQSWNPHFVRDEEVLEKVQRSAPRCVKGKGKEYIERLRVLGLTTLKRRRIRGALIETYKKENVNSETFFCLIDSDRHFRGHYLKLYRRCCHPSGNFSSLSEWSTTGTPCQSTLWKHLQSTHSRSGWTTTTKIWACSKADASIVHHLLVQVRVLFD